MHTKLRNFLIRNLPLIYWKFLTGTPIPRLSLRRHPEHQTVGPEACFTELESRLIRTGDIYQRDVPAASTKYRAAIKVVLAAEVMLTF